jgi:hypothetical protein
MHAINDAKAAMDSAEARVAADADGSDTQALEDMLNAMATFEAVGGYTQDKTVAEVYYIHNYIRVYTYASNIYSMPAYVLHARCRYCTTSVAGKRVYMRAISRVQKWLQGCIAVIAHTDAQHALLLCY